MRPVAYFPELRTSDAVVPARLAIGVDVDATPLPPSVTPATYVALTGESVRLELVSTPRTARRRPAGVPTAVIEA